MKTMHTLKHVGMLTLLALFASASAFGSDVQWTRLRGKVKATNAKTQMLTIENQEGDLLSLHLDADVDVLNGKDPVAKISDLKLGDTVTLLYDPKAATPADPDEPPPGGVYKSLK